MVFSPMTLMAEAIIMTKVILAAALGGAIGAEREIANKPAGLRTHMILAATTTLLVAIAPEVMREPLVPNDSTMEIRSDPLRIIEAIVAGVAFLGAGTIIRGRAGKPIEGLTTAASLLLVAAIGIAVALDIYLVAIATTILSLVMLRLVHRVELKILQRRD